MQLEPIITALRARTTATFVNRIAGAAQFKQLPETAQLAVPCAYVIPMEDTPGESKSSNTVRQALKDSFSVVVAVSNLADEKGQGGAASIHTIRAVLFASLLGWQPSQDYSGIVYEGGTLLSLDRARLWYQFDFSADTEIGPEDGYQKTALDALPPFEGGTMRVDAIDPSDSNIVATPAPDGRNESGFTFPKTGNFPE